MRISSVRLLLFLSLLAAHEAGAQADSGEPGGIRGVIVDVAGDPIRNVRVQLRQHNAASRGTLNYVMTDNAGRFEFIHLRYGTFDILASPGSVDPSLPAVSDRRIATVQLKPDHPILTLHLAMHGSQAALQ
jgi:hypothetical protein